MSRFHGRSEKSGFKNAAELWKESPEQHQKGRLRDPIQMADNQEHCTLMNRKMHVPFLLGAEKPGKLRDGGDVRYSATNLAGGSETPYRAGFTWPRR